MKDSGSYANPINSSFQKFQTTSITTTVMEVDRRCYGRGQRGVFMGTSGPFVALLDAIQP